MDANSKPVMSTDSALMQKVNFLEHGGHLNFEEFRLLITRIMGYTDAIDFDNPRDIKEAAQEIGGLGDPIQRMRAEA
jgi:hypothetical protein